MRLTANNYGAKATIAADELGKSIPAADLGCSRNRNSACRAHTTTNANGTTDSSTSPSLCDRNRHRRHARFVRCGGRRFRRERPFLVFWNAVMQYRTPDLCPETAATLAFTGATC